MRQFGFRMKFKTLSMSGEEKHGHHFDFPIFFNMSKQFLPKCKKECGRKSAPTVPPIDLSYSSLHQCIKCNKWTFVFILPFSVLGCAFSAKVVCSKYAKDVGGGGEGGGGGMAGYYVRMPPKDCRADKAGNWRPTFKIVSIPSHPLGFKFNTAMLSRSFNIDLFWIVLTCAVEKLAI